MSNLQKWKYTIVVQPGYSSQEGLDDALERLNRLGDQGYELVSSIHVLDSYGNITFIHHFKKPVEWDTVVGVMTT